MVLPPLPPGALQNQLTFTTCLVAGTASTASRAAINFYLLVPSTMRILGPTRSRCVTNRYLILEPCVADLLTRPYLGLAARAPRWRRIASGSEVVERTPLLV